MMRIFCFTIVCLVMAAFPILSPAAGPANVGGDWEFSTPSPIPFGGDMLFDLSITQNGDKLSVIMKEKKGDRPPLTGTGSINGNEIKWSASMGQGPMISYAGKVEGNSMSGTNKAPGLPDGKWKAVRKAKPGSK
jgi:hypothetical protein